MGSNKWVLEGAQQVASNPGYPPALAISLLLFFHTSQPLAEHSASNRKAEKGQTWPWWGPLRVWFATLVGPVFAPPPSHFLYRWCRILSIHSIIIFSPTGAQANGDGSRALAAQVGCLRRGSALATRRRSPSPAPCSRQCGSTRSSLRRHAVSWP